MRTVYKVVAIVIAVLGIFGIAYILLHGANIPVLQPKGVIADKQLQLIIVTTLLGMIVIVPVFVMLFAFAWKYREGNKKAKYTPNADGNKWIEALWWGIPIIIITILSVITWVSTHDLDPYKKLESTERPIKVQVVALQWRWLFIYPEQGVATINEVRFPEKTPVEFELTADAPMNGFWIPSLGGQVYAMAGMSSKLSLMADSVGEYNGSSSNISGEGYAGMSFKAISMKKTEFDLWARTSTKKAERLDWEKYDQDLVSPSKEQGVRVYSLFDAELYNKIVMKYMHGGSEPHSPDKTDNHSEMKMDHDSSDPEHHMMEIE